MSKNQTYEISTERIDDIVLLLSVMKQIGLPEIINQYLPRHGNEKGLDWGWVSVIWLAYILSKGDHRKVKVRDWVAQRSYTLETVCGLELRETDFTDDRLSILLRRLSQGDTWSKIERHLSRESIRVYSLPTQQIRFDATTNSGYHQVSEEGLFQFGKSKDNPNLAQIKTMMGSLDPLGMPVATLVVSGEKADDGLYLPAFEQVTSTLNQPELLCVGDCKMSAIKTRASIHCGHHYYLTPLSRIGTVPEQLEGWIDQAQKGSLESIEITRPLENGKQKFLGTGYELERKQETMLNGKTQTWTERVFLIRSQSYLETQIRGLHQRLDTAQEKLLALTPAVGRGKRQVREEEELCRKAEEILRHHRVEGLLGYTYDYEVPTRRCAGRYQITGVTRHQNAIEEVEKQFGWRAYVTNAPKERLSVPQGLLTYRDEWIAERSFHRLKGVPLSLSPFFVQRDDQVQGLVHLLSLAVRLLTLIEFVVRTRLKASGESLVGLYRGSPSRSTQRPTAEKILEAFENVTVTLFEIRGNAYAHVSELNSVQQQIIRCLGLSPDIYSGLVDSS